MKVGINLLLWTVHVDESHFPLFAKLKETGYDGLEIPLSDYSEQELKSISQALKDNGLLCTTSNVLGEEENPIAEEKKIRQQAIDKLKADVDKSTALASEILIGPMHSAHKRFVGRGPSEQEFEYCAEVLRAVGEYALGANLKLGIEFLNRFECYFLTHTADADKLTDMIGLDNVGILYDTHHANIEEANVYQSMTGAQKNINHIHISESHRGTPGTGQVNWVETFEALKANNYNNWLVVEAFGSKIADLVNAVNIWRDCFASEEEVYKEAFKLIQNGMRA